MNAVQVTVSGSFTRHIEAIQRDVESMRAMGVRVLSPEQPYVVDALDGFVFVASDRHRSVRLVQDRHLAAIANSDFLWLVSPDGHVGQSAAMELGFAVGLGVPVMSIHLPPDLTMRQYVTQVPSLAAAVARTSAPTSTERRSDSLLLNPESATNAAAGALERIRTILTASSSVERSRSLSTAVRVERDTIARVLALPTHG